MGNIEGIGGWVERMGNIEGMTAREIGRSGCAHLDGRLVSSCFSPDSAVISNDENLVY